MDSSDRLEPAMTGVVFKHDGGYGPVEMGGQRFICPKRSVVITRERTVRPVSFWRADFSVYGPYQTLMNDTTYTNYHKFGTQLRILPGFEEVHDGKPH